MSNENNSQSNSQQYTKKQLTLIVISILMCSLAFWLARFKTNAILPIIAGDLNGMTYYAWTTTMFMLCSAIVAPLWGKVSDIFGRKTVLCTLLLIMICGETISAFAPNIFVLIAGYAVTGLGAGGMQGTYFALLGDLFAPDKRGKYGGMILVVMAVTQFLLPMITAFIASSFTWRYVFYLVIIVYIISLAVTLTLIPNIKNQGTKKKIDFVGLLLVVLAAVPFILALSWAGSKYKWTSPVIICMFVFSILMFVLLYNYEKRIPEFAIISTKLLKNRGFLFCCLVSVFMSASMTGNTIYLPLFVQGVQGSSASAYAAVVMPSYLVSIVAGPIAGLLMDKTKRYKWMLVMATVSSAIICVIYGIVPATVNAAILAVILVIWKLLGAAYMPSVNPLAALAQIDERDFGVGTGTLNFMTAIGQSIMSAILGSTLTAAYASNINRNIAAIASDINTHQMSIISTPRALVNPATMAELSKSFNGNTALFDQTVSILKTSLRGTLTTVYLVMAALVCISAIFAILVKEIPLDKVQPKQTGDEKIS